jgi:HTH-type transcriptional regulator/antitoxin HipB
LKYLVAISGQLAPQLRSLRKVRRLSQKDLATRLGVSQSRIAAIESNPASISTGQLLAILAVLGVSMVLRDTPTSALTDSAPSPGKTDAKLGGEW